MANKKMLRVEEVAKLFGLSKASINHYINMGLIEVSLRKGNKRFFEVNTANARLKLIRSLQEKGFLLRQIKEKVSQKNKTNKKSGKRR